MTQSFFISDLHLCQTRPHTTQLFINFLSDQAIKAERLYILGDLFDAWAGDDDLDHPHHHQVVMALRQLSQQGTVVYLMHGNRDFLIADDFAAASSAELLSDPLQIKLYGYSAVLTHGDVMCTDDVNYQTFRKQVRDPQWQKDFLSRPLDERKMQIAALRARSEQEKSGKDATIMDVNADAVDDMLRTHHYPELLIHGHTHRLARHLLEVDGRKCERIVLGDWDVRGSCLVCNENGCEFVPVV